MGREGKHEECSYGESFPDDGASMPSQAAPSEDAMSLRSGLTNSTRHGRLGISDVLSDVPTIAESVADMRDFNEMAKYSSSHTSQSSSMTPGAAGLSVPENAEEEEEGPAELRTPHSLVMGSSLKSSGCTVDARAHPLGVHTVTSPDEHISSTAGSEVVTVGELGDWGDVPSIRDDSSVISVPSVRVNLHENPLAHSRLTSTESFHSGTGCVSPRLQAGTPKKLSDKKQHGSTGLSRKRIFASSEDT